MTERKIFLVITIKSIFQTTVNVSVNSQEWSFYAPVANVYWHLNRPLIIPLVWISLKHHSIICWKMYVVGISRPMSLFLCLSVTVTEIRSPWFMNKWLPCIPMLVIGKHAEPRCFKGSNMDLLPENYKWRKNAWIDSVIFEEWVRKLDPRRWERQTGRSCYVLITAQHYSQGRAWQTRHAIKIFPAKLHKQASLCRPGYYTKPEGTLPPNHDPQTIAVCGWGQAYQNDRPEGRYLHGSQSLGQCLPKNHQEVLPFGQFAKLL